MSSIFILMSIVDMHLSMLMFPCFLRIHLRSTKYKFTRWLPTWCKHSCSVSQAQEWELFSTVTVEPSRPSNSTTPRSTHWLRSRSHTQNTHKQICTQVCSVFSEGRWESSHLHTVCKHVPLTILTFTNTYNLGCNR